MQGFDQPTTTPPRQRCARSVPPGANRGAPSSSSCAFVPRSTGGRRSVDGIYPFEPEPPSIRASILKNNPLSGVTFPRLVRLLRHKHAQHKRGESDGIDWTLYWHRIAGLLIVSIFNWCLELWECLYVRLCLGDEMKIAREDDRAPVFILGHPRTGTTLLHSLLALDTERFAVCDTFCAGFPTAFLSFETLGKRIFAPILSPTRPMDAMPLHFSLPQEDELATCLLLGGNYSPYMSIYFMRDEKSYRRYQSLRGEDLEGRGEWIECFKELCQKLKCRDLVQQRKETERKDSSQRGTSGSSFMWNRTIHSLVTLVRNVLRPLVRSSERRHRGDCGNDLGPRRLLLKSPCHTARAELLLELYPDAKFVYIHRNPYEVFLSGCHMADTTYGHFFLQRPCREVIQEYILAQGEILVGEYGRCKEMGLLNEKNLVEISFHDLTANTYSTVSRIYQSLGLSSRPFPPDPTDTPRGGCRPDSDAVGRYAERLLEECRALRGYKKNAFHDMELDDEIVETVRKRWLQHFAEYGYDMAYPPLDRKFD